MSEAWSEYALERTRRAIAEERYFPRNGKVFFKRFDRSRGFIFEAELGRGLLRLRPVKESHTYTAFDSVDELLDAGWVIE